MVEVSLHSATPGSVAFLFHPSMVGVIDVFRSLSSLEDQYDLALLDGPEQGLAAYAQPEAAKGIVSGSEAGRFPIGLSDPVMGAWTNTVCWR
jgi:hypothetical protein